MTAEVVASGFNYPEGPTWHEDGCILMVNAKSNLISRVWEDGRVEEYARTFGVCSGSTIGPDGNLYVTDNERKAVVRFDESAHPTIWVDTWDGGEFKGPNDLVFDADGILFFTDPIGSSVENPIGGVYRMTSYDEPVTQIAGDFAHPNGLATDPDNQHLYVAESKLNRIRRISLTADNPQWEIFAELPGEGEPDGMRFDAEGNLYVAHFGTGTVRVIDSSGKLIQSIEVGANKPTNLEFGGKDGKTLYITELDTNTLRRVRVDVPGMKFKNR